MSAPDRIAVLGGGSWGTALAGLLAGKGRQVHLWAREPQVVEAIRATRTNPVFLPGRTLPEGVEASTDLESVVRDADLVVSVTPAQHVRAVVQACAPVLRPDVHIVSASKGIEIRSLERMDGVFASLVGPERMRRFTVLSGPSFAAEVAAGEPTAVVVASADTQAALDAQSVFQTETFRVYTSGDVVGVELAGALKNVIALASGVVAGLGFGHNTRAAVMTRGLAEIARLGLRLGAQPGTFAGLAGMGDLVLTCTGELSRNRTVGYRLGRGEALDAILGEMTSVAEGVATVQAVVALAGREGVDMPIASEVHAILTEGRPPQEAIRRLMSRDPKPEEWS
ncbi:MAG: NAD(P)H-dependent glycerol-3-phosphate dehydrogenase [Gemmatimonadota bacterium]|nr:NAD(P)-dependent glycerol-3-phosphate dehydrogenase [Gemmatimonadota bacterium]